jgi:hypothetical protein
MLQKDDKTKLSMGAHGKYGQKGENVFLSGRRQNFYGEKHFLEL